MRPTESPTFTGCQNLDPAAGLLKPCYTAAPGTEHHWCDWCLVTEVRRLRGERDQARQVAAETRADLNPFAKPPRDGFPWETADGSLAP